MTYHELFTEDCVLLDPTADADSLLRALAENLAARHPALADRAEEAFAALRTREDQGSTGSQGVAIPHVKMADLDQVAVAIAVNKDGLDWRALDGEPIHVAFCILRPEADADAHLGLLRWVAGLAQHQDFVNFACQADSPAQVLDLLLELAPA